jgi:beta-glucosidase
VLVLTTGSALAVDWAQQRLPAILVAWYPGQRGGTAVADALFGVTNPAGRLPVTFYKASEKLPPFDDYSMQGRTYRYFDGEPLYPFGYGLSYTRFDYSGLTLDRTSADGDTSVRATVTVRNAGSRAGDEVVQMYVSPVSPTRSRAIKELRGVERVTLQPGESRTLTFEIVPSRHLTVYDEGRRAYVVDPGRFEVQLGASSTDIRQRASLEVR